MINFIQTIKRHNRFFLHQIDRNLFQNAIFISFIFIESTK